jgi:hypothetical protein
VAIEIQLNLGINYPWKNQFPLKTDIWKVSILY